MPHFTFCVCALLSLAALTGCQRAGRYPSAPVPAAADTSIDAPTMDRSFIWMEPSGPIADMPIVFVADTSEEWRTLPEFWNLSPPPGAGMPTAHLGLSPLAAAVAVAASDQLHAVKIKVPRGLPDPTPFLSSSNPPTFAKWKLGKQLFFDRIIPGTYRSCARCHQPEHGFANDDRTGPGNARNTLGLINSVYNTSQFWDGRASSLEETVFRPGESQRIASSVHNFGDIARNIVENEQLHQRYAPQFRAVFGIRRPTQDAIAKALATYMRTILVGDAIVDRAEHERERQNEERLSARHFAAVLDEASLKRLGERFSERTARDLERGHELFHGRAGCVRCHSGPLYRDGDFHNIGLENSDAPLLIGENLGRFEHLPVGLKDKRYLGAHRTPSLRALPRTPPYMHDGRFRTLADVIDHYNRKLDATRNRYVAEALLDSPGRARRLQLDESEARALTLYLQALEGTPVDAIVAGSRR